MTTDVIARNNVERIFEPFVRLAPAEGREPTKGIGLGLAISRDLARAMAAATSPSRA